MNYNITASVTSTPSDIALQLNNQNLEFIRSTVAGDWAGQTELELVSPIDLNFRAVGIEGSPWTLTINISAINSESEVTTYHRWGTIPSDMLVIFIDTIIIK